MKTVKVINGGVRTGDGRFEPGSTLQLDDESADSLVKLGVVVIIDEPEKVIEDLVESHLEPEEQVEPEVDELQGTPVMSVEEEPFETPRKKKRGKRRG